MGGFNQYINLLWVMTEKELKVRYKRAFLGFLWILLNPLLQMFIIGYIFSLFVKIPNYYVFLLSGLLPWTFFSQSLSSATPSIVRERALLQKAVFPIEAVPVSVIFSNFVHFISSFVLLLIFLLLTSSFSLINVFLLLLVFFWLLILTVGVVLICSALQVKFRDVIYVIRTLLILGFYVSPIIYTLSMIPSNLRTLYLLNPLSSIIEIIHILILNRGLLDPQMLASNIIITFLIVLLGIWIFNNQKKSFVDWI